jgi:hypothetical protein
MLWIAGERLKGAPITWDTDQTDRAGVHLCGLRVTRKLGMVFREQDTSDFGVPVTADTDQASLGIKQQSYSHP